jgi:hypothetical protein
MKLFLGHSCQQVGNVKLQKKTTVINDLQEKKTLKNQIINPLSG